MIPRIQQNHYKNSIKTPFIYVLPSIDGRRQMKPFKIRKFRQHDKSNHWPNTGYRSQQLKLGFKWIVLGDKVHLANNAGFVNFELFNKREVVFIGDDREVIELITVRKQPTLCRMAGKILGPTKVVLVQQPSQLNLYRRERLTQSMIMTPKLTQTTHGFVRHITQIKINTYVSFKITHGNTPDLKKVAA